MERNKLASKILKYGTLSLVLFATLFTFMFSNMNVGATTKYSDASTISKYGESLGDNYSTEYSGRIWTDKSVFSNSVGIDDKTYHLKSDEDFINIFSTLATAETIAGKKQAPVDVVFVIDISGSMSNANSEMENGYSRIYNTITALNQSIKSIMDTNPYTRVGVVAYNHAAVQLLPLGRYNNPNADYVTVYANQYYRSNRRLVTKKVTGIAAAGVVSGEQKENHLESVYIETNAILESDNTKISKTAQVTGGTNIQHGMYTGMNLLATERSTTVVIDGTTVQRYPSVVLLSDGNPTYSSKTEEWWAPTNEYIGPGYDAVPGNGLKTMLVSSYMKDAIDRNYKLTNSSQDTKLYTIGMGINDLADEDEKHLARMVLNPSILWNTNATNAMVTDIKSAWESYKNNGTPTITCQYDDLWNDEITQILRHPSSNDVTSIHEYVDNHYDADNASAVTEVFKTIVTDISVNAAEVPTEIKNGNALESGYVTYVDPIGEYLEVKEVKSILFPQPNVPEKSQEFTNPTIKEEGNKTTYTFNGNVNTFVHGVQDMSKLIITVEKDADGNETMTIQVPAGLIPLRINSVELDSSENVVKHTHNGALPLHVVYSVGLQKDVLDNNGIVNSTVVSPEYIQANSNTDGTVNFYSNLYTGNKVNGADVGNATVEFEPSHTNPFYYVQRNIPIYSDEACTQKVTSLQSMIANQTYYYKEHFYHGNQSKYLVIGRSGEILMQSDLIMVDGYVHRAAGSPRPNRILEFEGTKTNNITNTAEDFYYPTFVYADNSNDPYAGKYKIYLGNNGVLQANATGTLAIHKVVTADEGLTAPDKEFTFKINFNGSENLTGPFTAVHTDAEGRELHRSEVTDGSMVHLKANETITVLNLPFNTTYEVIETQLAGFKVAPTSGKIEGTITAGQISEANFTNHYSVTPVTVDGFDVTKVFTGREWLNSDTFTFILESDNLETPMPEGSMVIENHKQSTTIVTKSNQTSEFGDITFTKPGTYTYVISEEQASIPGISYSGAMYEVTVKVEDTGNGTLTKEVTMTQLAADNGADLNTTIDNQIATFTNTFDAEEVNWIPVGTKAFIDNSGKKSLTNGMFTFKVEALTKGAPLPSTNGRNDVVPNSSVEIVYEAITFTKEHAGTTEATAKEYTYKFTEVIPTTPINGMTYDTNAYEVTVKVYLDGENIVVIPTYPNNKTHVEFTNTYTPTPTSISLGGSKQLTGREWLTDETFTFNLVATNDAAKTLTINKDATATKTNKSFTFGAINITKPDTYTFEITETKGNAGGMTYDESVVEVTVNVVDNDGQLEATVLYDNSLDKPVFENTYTSIFTGTPISVDGTKTLTGQSLEEGEFFYVVEPINGAPLLDRDVLVTNNKDEDNDGVATINIIKNLTFTSAGIYQYKVYERIPETKITGMTYDTNYFIIAIQVVDNNDGTLTANTPIITKYDKNGNKLEGDTVAFLNQYVPTPVEIRIPVLTKVLEGFRNDSLKANEFEFTLTLENATLLDGTTIPTDKLNNYVVLPTTTTVKNNEQGEIRFDNITFKQAGYYTIKVSEVIPDGATRNADGTYTLGAITYTNNELVATLKVTDDNLGTLTHTIHEEIGGTNFRNKYDTSANLNIEVSKLFTGRNNNEWVDGDAFTFELLVADSLTQDAITNGYVILPSTKQVTIDNNDTDHKALLGNIQFTKPGTYKFIVRELPGTIAGVNYDGNAKEIEVVVTDQNNGTMTITGTTVTETNNQYTSNVSFENVYDPGSTVLSGHQNLHVNKVFTGREWLDTDQFNFVLALTNSTNVNNNALGQNEKAVVLPRETTLTVTKDNKDVAHFGDITFNTTGTFTFTITEQASNLEGVTDDENKVRTIVVDVTEVEGKLVATVNNQSSEELTFTNTYTAQNTTVMIPVEKVFVGRNWTDELAFNFKLDVKHQDTLKAITDKNVVLPNNTEITIDSNNPVKAFEAITFKKPGTYEFIVYEITGNNSKITYDQNIYTVNITVIDNNEGELVATTSFGEQNLVFTNTYTPEPIKAQFVGTKELTGRNLKDHEFIFSVSAVDNAPLPSKTTTSNVGETITFEEITYTEAGTYKYVISEVHGSLNGIIYDTRLVDVTVTINYDAQNGVFTKDVKYNANDTTFKFENSYSTNPSDPVSMNANKVVTPTLGNMYTLHEGDFTFEIDETSDKLTGYPKTVSTDAYGNAKLFDKVTFREVGTYTFEVKEVKGSQTGMTYDNSVYTVTVEVTDNETLAKLEAKVTITKDGNTVNAITFNNGYDPEDETVILKGEKELEGKPLNADEFTFTLEASEQTPNAPLPQTLTVKNDKDGKFEFGTITYDKPGVYVYEMKELAGTNPGITYDTNVAIATVTVTDIHGELTATVVYENKTAATDKAEFINIYTSTFDENTAVSLNGNKTLTGQSLEANEFTFAIQQVQPTVVDLGTVKNDANGNIQFFDKLTYTKAGTYVYEMKETVDSRVTGMTYDERVYTVTVEVIDDYQGKLSASKPVITVNGQKATEIKFVNTYVPTANTVELPLLKKVIAGHRHNPLTENEFTFVLDLITANPQDGIVLPTEKTVGNEANGDIVFDKITFTKAGTYTLMVGEVIPATPAQGMTYDAEKFEITYVVTDDSKGNLTATVTNTKGDHTFTNVYESEGSLQLEVEKVLQGREWFTTDEFTFELLVTDDATINAQNAGYITLPTKQTVKVDDETKDYKAKFDEIIINKEGTYEIVVREVTTNKIPGIHYDSHGRHVVINAKDNNKGKIDVTYTIKDDLTLTFTNIYDTETTELNGHDNLVIVKEFTGRPANKWLDTDKFVFTLAPKGDATIKAIEKGDVVLGSTRLEVTHTNKAYAHFENITFKEPGTYNFTVTEEETNILGVTNDANNVRNITVKVEDKGDGTLVATRTDNESLVFKNTYTVKQVELDGKTYLEVTKDLAGRNWFDTDVFTFTLKAANQTTKDAVTAKNIILPATEISMKKGDNGSKAFGNIIFKTPGEYQFAITETKGNIDGMSYDEHEVLVDVIVADNDEGQLIVAAPSYAGSMTFKNTYTPDEIFISLQGTKVLNGRTLKANEFEFEITAINNAPLPAVHKVTNDAEGKIKFAAIDFNKEGVYEYEIKELVGTLAGVDYDRETVKVTVTVTNNKNTGKLESTVTYSKPDGKGFTFTNNYFTNKTDEIPFTANKVVTPSEGNAYTLEEGTFKFHLKPAASNPASDPITTVLEVSNKADGTVEFANVQYSEAGTYVYTVHEVDNFLPGMTYDTSIYTITVKVVDDVNTAKLQKEVTITKDGTEVSEITFNNTYNPEETNAMIYGNKTLTGGHKQLEDHEFTFAIKPITANAPLPENTTTTNSASGYFNFGSIVFTQEGVYEYEISEVNEGKTGYTYDNSVHKVTVTVVNDQTNGGLVATVSGLDQVQFTNQYVPNPVSVKVLGDKGGFKELNGRPLFDKEFTFELIDVDANIIQTTNNADGTFEFDAITFDKVGTYYYTVVEKSSAIGGITFDDEVYEVIVDVIDNNSNLEAKLSFYKDEKEVERVTFANTYTALPTDIIISAIKELVGRVLVENEFTFNLYEANEFYETSNLISTAKNNAEGIVTFDSVPFEKEGTYYFVVNEEKGTLDRVTYDTTQYGYEVIVKDDLHGHLKVEQVTVTNLGTQEIASTIFKNIFTPKPDDISVQIKVQKTVTNTGNVIVGPKDFEFVLEDLSTGEKQVLKTDENGNALFTLDFSEKDIDKTFNFKLIETKGTLEEMIYDTTSYNIQVHVSLNENNVLVATVTSNGKVVGTQLITEFENINNASNDPILTINKSQSIDGKATVETLTVGKGDKVTYFLTVKNTGDGEATNVVITDALPKGLTYVENSATNSGVYADGILTWNIDTLAPGKEVTVSFEARVNEDDIKVKNIANANADNHDDTTSNQVEITVVPEPETPETSDNTHVYNYMLMMIFASAIIVVLKMKEALER